MPSPRDLNPVSGTSAVPKPGGAGQVIGCALGLLGHAVSIGVVPAVLPTVPPGTDLESGGRFGVVFTAVCLLAGTQTLLLTTVVLLSLGRGAGWRRGLWAGWAAGLASWLGLLALWIATG
ncbi:hypothetical protein Cs7R123_45290 [Catellatospora sp. TT07R-123]|uniref:hypothetical protein n=1 Tax=Catellatospora sp. TT07R-123 TaxID=2733863 RepID=UPI001B2C33FC|nr:hypothetical protein [Catellatospora sp. TT07R-123]GHJ47187.1 hypothetical protein Cs7R123_45290 [Catellatospora sp. TT07R-123]